MQTNLKSLFAGKREIVEVAGPGRPPKPREQAADEPDVVLVAVENQAKQPEAYDVDLAVMPQKCRRWSRAASLQAICEAAGKSLAALRMPGCSQRNNKHDGPQRKLALCIWMQKTHEDCGGTGEAWELVVGAVAEKWNVSRPDVLRTYEAKARWQEEC
jgi:hypothetical protein